MSRDYDDPDYNDDIARGLRYLDRIADAVVESAEFLERIAVALERVAEKLDNPKGPRYPGDPYYPLLVTEIKTTSTTTSQGVSLTGVAEGDDQATFSWTFHYSKGRWELQIREIFRDSVILKQTGLYGSPTDTFISPMAVMGVTKEWLIWPKEWGYVA